LGEQKAQALIIKNMSAVRGNDLHNKSRQKACDSCARVHQKCDGKIPCSSCAKKMQDYPDEKFVCHYRLQNGNLDVTLLRNIENIHTGMLRLETREENAAEKRKKQDQEDLKKQIVKKAIKKLNSFVKSVLPAATTELIEYGGSGFVACVKNQPSQQVWAFKGSLGWGDLARLSLLREYMMLCRVQNHHSMVSLLSEDIFGATGGLLHHSDETYLLLHYFDSVQHTNCHTFWKNPTRILEEVCEFAESIMEAVQFLELMGMRHNDIKWDNTMICMVRPVRVKLIDMGGAGFCTKSCPGENIFSRPVPVSKKALVDAAFCSALRLDAGLDRWNADQLHEFVYKAGQNWSDRATGGRGTGGFRFVQFEYTGRSDSEAPFSNDCFAVGLMIAVCLSGSTLMDVWRVIRKSSKVHVKYTDDGKMQRFGEDRLEEAWMLFLCVLYNPRRDVQCTKLVEDYIAAHLQAWNGKPSVALEHHSNALKRRRTAGEETTLRLKRVWELCGKLMWSDTSCHCVLKSLDWS
jgi:serine/threonine protein kinase